MLTRQDTISLSAESSVAHFSPSPLPLVVQCSDRRQSLLWRKKRKTNTSFVEACKVEAGSPEAPRQKRRQARRGQSLRSCMRGNLAVLRNGRNQVGWLEQITNKVLHVIPFFGLFPRLAFDCISSDVIKGLLMFYEFSSSAEKYCPASFSLWVSR